MHAGRSVLGPADVQAPSVEFDLRPLQIAQLGATPLCRQSKRPRIGLWVIHEFGVSSKRRDDFAQGSFLVRPAPAGKHRKDLLMSRCIYFRVQLLGI